MDIHLPVERKKMKKKFGVVLGIVLMVPVLLAPDMAQASTRKIKTIKTYFVVSRMEGKQAVLEAENGDQIKIQRSKLPKRAKEGDVLAYQKGRYRRDTKKTKERKQRIEAYMQNFFRK